MAKCDMENFKLSKSCAGPVYYRGRLEALLCAAHYDMCSKGQTISEEKMTKCLFDNDHCSGPAEFITEKGRPLCVFHTDLLNDLHTEPVQINKKDRYAIIREGPIFTPGQMVKIGLFNEEHNEYDVLGELHYAAAKEIVDKMNKE